MNETTIIVIDRDGIRGTIEATDIQAIEDESAAEQERVNIRLSTGQTFLVERDLLVRQDDGSYQLPFSFAELKGLRIPVIEEQVSIHKRRIEKGRLRISKQIEEENVLIDEALMQEEIQVERVPVNRFVDEPEEVRQDGDTMIVPVMEEVPVVEKRLLVREELHITRHQHETHDPQQVTRRREVVDIERLPPDPDHPASEG